MPKLASISLVLPNHRHLITSPSYHTYILFVLNSLHYNITYFPWLATNVIFAHFSCCQCGHTIDDLGIHLFWCMCGNGCITTHHTLQGIVAISALGNGTHLQKEVPHLFPSPHSTMNLYSYHQKWLIKCCHSLFDPFRYNTTCTIYDSTCNDKCHSYTHGTCNRK